MVVFNGELLGLAALEVAGEFSAAIQGLVVAVVVVFDEGVSEVDAVFGRAARHCGVGSFAGELVVGVDEGAVDGAALGFVDGCCVGVDNGVGVEVAGRRSPRK